MKAAMLGVGRVVVPACVVTLVSAVALGQGLGKPGPGPKVGTVDLKNGPADCAMNLSTVSIDKTSVESGDSFSVKNSAPGARLDRCTAFFVSNGAFLAAKSIAPSTSELQITVPIMMSGPTKFFLVPVGVGGAVPTPPATLPEHSQQLTVSQSVPVIKAPAPASGKPGDTIEIEGSNLRPGEPWKAHFKLAMGATVDADVAWVNQTKMKIVVPDPGGASFVMATMPSKLTVTRGTTSSNVVDFTYSRPKPPPRPTGGTGGGADFPSYPGYTYVGALSCQPPSQGGTAFLQDVPDGPAVCCMTSQGADDKYCGKNRSHYASWCQPHGPKAEAKKGGCYATKSP
jgi:hypothetical protein